MIKVIGTGSKGNCYLISTENESLLVECGLNIKEILQGIEFNTKDLKGCLITHEHKDHCKAYSELMKRGIDIYSSEGTFKALGVLGQRHTKVIKHMQKFIIGGFTVLALNSVHDCNEPLMYVINHKEIGQIVFITDTSRVDYAFKDFDYLMIECNFGMDYIENTELDLAKRIIESHLSYEAAASTLKEYWNFDKCKEILLIHLSNERSNAIEFEKGINEITGVKTTVAVKGGIY